MSQGIIELNDATMTLGVDGAVLDQSAGFAVLDENRLMVGTDARNNIKLLPRWTNNKFWSQLNTDGLSNATSSVRHHADLAFAHLEHLQKRMDVDQTVIAVPAHFAKAQLGLLLGMCKEAGLPVKSLVDLALLSIVNQPSHVNALFLDAGLHSITLTTLRTDGVLRQTGNITLLETGLATFWDRWASLIAEQFIQSSRFDPMHEALSEQKLFDLVPDFMQNIGEQRALKFDLSLGSVTHSTSLSKDQLQSATASAYPTIVQGVRQHAPESEDFSLFISPRLKYFPELMSSLSLIPNAEIVQIEDSQLIENSHDHWTSLVNSENAVSHVTTLHVETQQPRPTASRIQPSHILIGDHLYGLKNSQPISGFSEGLETSAASAILMVQVTRDETTLKILHNGLSINGEAQAPGDVRLNVGDDLEVSGHKARVVAAV